MAKVKQPTRAELRKRLARDIAAVFANPETPSIIYNGLAHAMDDLFNALPVTPRNDESEEYVFAVLEEAANQLRGGTR